MGLRGRDAGAITGDIVRSKITSKAFREGKPMWSGKIVEVSQRKNKRFVGSLGKLRGQIELDDDRFEVHVLLAGLAQHFGNHALRQLAVFRVSRHLDDDLRPRLDMPRGGVGRGSRAPWPEHRFGPWCLRPPGGHPRHGRPVTVPVWSCAVG